MMLTSVVLQRSAYSASRSACYSAIMSTDSRRFCSSSKSERVGQRVLVTGGANGVGRGIVDRFVREGAMVAYADIVKEGMTVGFAKPQFSNVDSRVSVVAANIPTCPEGAHFIECDASHPEQVEAAVATALELMDGRLDVLINNVGAHFEPGRACHELSVEAWDRAIAVNLRAHFLFSKFCLRDAFVPQRAGAIVNVGSVHGFQNGPGLPAYAAAKGGILAFTRQLAVEYASVGVRVNCVVPGTINTPMNVNFMEAKDEVTARSPIVRWGTPDEVASAVVFLASDQASFITGESLAVDGGLLAKGVWADNETPGLGAN